MSNLLDEKWLESLPEPVIDNMEKLNAEVIKVICERIKYFGDLRPTEVKKLTNSLEFLGGDMRTIERIIRKYTNLSSREIEGIFENAAKENDEFAKQYYRYRGIEPITHTSDEYLQNVLRAITDTSLGNMTNLSDTYGFKFAGQKAMTLRRTYTRVIDRAIYEVQAGITDYNTAMQKFVKELSDSGVRIVEWESGYSRRVDSAARMNILDGVRRLNQEMMLYHGEQYGSDGVELSAHALSAPDHLPVQGRQFSNAEFNNMQNGLGCTDVNGNVYEGFERPIGEWNCKHFAFPIVIGVSEPTYSEEQLQSMQKNSIEKYDATQKMRQMETNLRKLKERRMAYSSAGNELDAVRTQRKINLKTNEYKQFCADNGLTPQTERVNVEGYKRISVSKNNMAHPRIYRGNVWSKEGSLISKADCESLVSYAKAKGIKLVSFENFDGDVNLIYDMVNNASIVLKDFPKLSNGKTMLQIHNSFELNDDDFASTIGNKVFINNFAFRNADLLENEYNQLTKENFYVRGTDSSSIIYHELGHVVRNIYQIPIKEVLKKTFPNKDMYFFQENLSKYSGFFDSGKEIIAESFSSVYSIGSRNKIALTIYEECIKMIKEKGDA